MQILIVGSNNNELALVVRSNFPIFRAIILLDIQHVTCFVFVKSLGNRSEIIRNFIHFPSE